MRAWSQLCNGQTIAMMKSASASGAKTSARLIGGERNNDRRDDPDRDIERRVASHAKDPGEADGGKD